MGLPRLQRDVIDAALPRIEADARVIGVALAGSIAAGRADEYSDVDLIVVVADDAFERVMAERLDLLADWTPLVTGFTGEHVGEPRLIVSLVGPPLVHLDAKFVQLSDFAKRIDDPLIIADRDGTLARELATHPLETPPTDLQWMEDRFWVWVHYGATKLGRGELFEVLSVLADLRSLVLGPLAALRAGQRPRGVRRLEAVAPDDARALQPTVGAYDAAAAAEALLACVDLYREWMGDLGDAVARRSEAERLAVAYLADVVVGPAENTSGG
ncbi:nucleotidyltransferase domain-containing protein [Leifsonia poae]|uniref:Oxalate:formate antiporter n=1 Tax=Leifsonia poae TaxID=110933 RepID=A0A9W6HBK0_9MICO|nr:nucleotidyltransferase domain-containing protein [Leifsonia poae]GLJ77019.1 oxalate:formate antiporter [Leifsonia poae]